MEKIENSILQELSNDLRNESAEYVVSKWIMEKIPSIFNNDYEHYWKVKNNLSRAIGVDSCSIIFVGSSSTGFSLNPDKDFKKYDNESDIDIAIISHYYFDLAWRTIKNCDKNQMPDTAEAIKSHRKKYIYEGTITTDKILGLMPFEKEWKDAQNELIRDKLFSDRQIHFRLYQDHEALRDYHVRNLKNIISKLDVQPSVTKL